MVLFRFCGTEESDPPLDVVGHPIHFHPKIHFFLTAKTGAPGAVVEDETGDDPLNLRPQFHVGLEGVGLAVSQQLLMGGPVVADEDVAGGSVGRRFPGIGLRAGNRGTGRA